MCGWFGFRQSHVFVPDSSPEFCRLGNSRETNSRACSFRVDGMFFQAWPG